MTDHTNTLPARKDQRKTNRINSRPKATGEPTEARQALPVTPTPNDIARTPQRAAQRPASPLVIATVTVAGAWLYDVAISPEPLRSEAGDQDLGRWDAYRSMILLTPEQSAKTALATVAHEFVHAWIYHIDNARKAVTELLEDLQRATGQRDASIDLALAEREVECLATMCACWANECRRVALEELLEEHFGEGGRDQR